MFLNAFLPKTSQTHHPQISPDQSDPNIISYPSNQNPTIPSQNLLNILTVQMIMIQGKIHDNEP